MLLDVTASYTPNTLLCFDIPIPPEEETLFITWSELMEVAEQTYPGLTSQVNQLKQQFASSSSSSQRGDKPLPSCTTNAVITTTTTTTTTMTVATEISSVRAKLSPRMSTRSSSSVASALALENSENVKKRNCSFLDMIHRIENYDRTLKRKLLKPRKEKPRRRHRASSSNDHETGGAGDTTTSATTAAVDANRQLRQVVGDDDTTFTATTPLPPQIAFDSSTLTTVTSTSHSTSLTEGGDPPPPQSTVSVSYPNPSSSSSSGGGITSSSSSSQGLPQQSDGSGWICLDDDEIMNLNEQPTTGNSSGPFGPSLTPSLEATMVTSTSKAPSKKKSSATTTSSSKKKKSKGAKGGLDGEDGNGGTSSFLDMYDMEDSMIDDQQYIDICGVESYSRQPSMNYGIFSCIPDDDEDDGAVDGGILEEPELSSIPTEEGDNADERTHSQDYYAAYGDFYLARTAGQQQQQQQSKSHNSRSTRKRHRSSPPPSTSASPSRKGEKDKNKKKKHAHHHDHTVKEAIAAEGNVPRVSSAEERQPHQRNEKEKRKEEKKEKRKKEKESGGKVDNAEKRKHSSHKKRDEVKKSDVKAKAKEQRKSSGENLQLNEKDGALNLLMCNEAQAPGLAPERRESSSIPQSATTTTVSTTTISILNSAFLESELVKTLNKSWEEHHKNLQKNPKTILRFLTKPKVALLTNYFDFLRDSYLTTTENSSSTSGGSSNSCSAALYEFILDELRNVIDRTTIPTTETKAEYFDRCKIILKQWKDSKLPSQQRPSSQFMAASTTAISLSPSAGAIVAVSQCPNESFASDTQSYMDHDQGVTSMSQCRELESDFLLPMTSSGERDQQVMTSTATTTTQFNSSTSGRSESSSMYDLVNQLRLDMASDLP